MSGGGWAERRGARFSVLRRTSVRRPPAEAVGSTLKRAPRVSGVTLIEMTIVVGLIALIAGITFPAFTSGIDTLRLNQSANGVVSFFNEALNRAERREQAVAITVIQAQNTLVMQSVEPGFEKKLELPQGVSIVKVLPEAEPAEDGTRQFLLYPGGAVPRVGIEIANSRHALRVVRVDPITGVPQVERAEEK
jgi:type II secretory pathway pseudopilin PulG